MAKQSKQRLNDRGRTKNNEAPAKRQDAERRRERPDVNRPSQQDRDAERGPDADNGRRRDIEDEA